MYKGKIQMNGITDVDVTNKHLLNVGSPTILYSLSHCSLSPAP